MDRNDSKQIIEDLRNGIIKQKEISKENFMSFRNVLIKESDFQSFRGNAQVGGNVIYTYEPGWTK